MCPNIVWRLRGKHVLMVRLWRGGMCVVDSADRAVEDHLWEVSYNPTRPWILEFPPRFILSVLSRQTMGGLSGRQSH